jgi:hypothetical protein
MVWGFSYLRIFKKLHSISGRSLVHCTDCTNIGTSLSQLQQHCKRGYFAKKKDLRQITL